MDQLKQKNKKQKENSDTVTSRGASSAIKPGLRVLKNYPSKFGSDRLDDWRERTCRVKDREATGRTDIMYASMQKFIKIDHRPTFAELSISGNSFRQAPTTCWGQRQVEAWHNTSSCQDPLNYFSKNLLTEFCGSLPCFRWYLESFS